MGMKKEKIRLEKDQRSIYVYEGAAKILKKAGWREADESPVILKQKLGTEVLKTKLSEAPQEVKELLTPKKEVAVAAKEDDFTPDGKPEIIKAKLPVKTPTKKRVRKSKPKAK
jgi:hypothetical protein